MSLFGDQNPSPEREPRRNPSTPRPQLLVNEIDPVSLTCTLTNPDEMQNMLQLCGITPTDDAIEYLWETLKHNRLLDLDTFRQSLGALGLSLELCVTSRQELQWFPEDYCETRSVALSTQHREGSELGYIQNLNEGHPGLDGLLVELSGSERRDTQVQCKISWEFNHDIPTGPGMRWDLIRSIYRQLKEKEIPCSLPVAPGQNGSFHYLAVELDPFIIQVERTKGSSTSNTHQDAAKEPVTNPIHELQRFDLKLKDPSPFLLTRILEISGSPQLCSPWVKGTSPAVIVQHMFECLQTQRPFNVDTLMMCDGATPCLVFLQERISDGESYPPKLLCKSILRDYTSAPGEFHLELEGELEEATSEQAVEIRNVIAQITWRRGHPILGTQNVNRIRHLARNHIVDERYQS